MAVIDFPDSPTVGQQHTQNGKTWEYNGVGWKLVLGESATLSWDNITGKPAFGTAALENVEEFATFEQGSLASSAVQPDDLPVFGNIVTQDSSAFATAAQGALADSAVQPDDIPDNIDIEWTFDGDKVYSFLTDVLTVKHVLLFGIHLTEGVDYVFDDVEQTLTLDDGVNPEIDNVLIINVEIL